MTKFLFYTDIHFASEVPRSRLDDFPKTLLAKQKEIYEIAHREKCDFVAFGGDYFNYHHVYSFPILGATMDILDACGMVTYMVLGEHDLYGHNIDSFSSSTLAFVSSRCKNIHVLMSPERVSEDVTLYPKHETDAIDVMSKFQKNSETCNICLCHELLTSQKNTVFECFNTTDIGPTGFDLVLSGDLHSGYPTHEANGTIFCNPGSIARRTIADAGRMPQVAIVTVENATSKPDIRLVQLSVAKDGSEVFDMSAKEAEQIEKNTTPTDFTKDLMEIERRSADIYEFIREMAAQENLAQEMIDYIFCKREQLQESSH